MNYVRVCLSCGRVGWSEYVNSMVVYSIYNGTIVREEEPFETKLEDGCPNCGKYSLITVHFNNDLTREKILRELESVNVDREKILDVLDHYHKKRDILIEQKEAFYKALKERENYVELLMVLEATVENMVKDIIEQEIKDYDPHLTSDEISLAVERIYSMIKEENGDELLGLCEKLVKIVERIRSLLVEE